MKGKKQKYYVVWKGAVTGVFDDWAECEASVKGFTGAVYQGFNSMEAAEAAYSSGTPEFKKKEKANPEKKFKGGGGCLTEGDFPLFDSWTVDAACKGNPGELEYRGVDTRTGKEVFRMGPFPEGTVNIGEFLAIVHALALMKKKGLELPVYSDSLTARKWVKEKAIKTKLPRSPENDALFDLVRRALAWLRTNTYKNKVLVWKTDVWGEIPADFGRK